MNKNLKKMIGPIIVVISLVILNIRLGMILFNHNLPNVIMIMGLLLPFCITVIVIVVMFGRIHEVKNIERDFDFSNLSILIAEANVVNREILAVILEKTGIIIDFTESGKKTISQFMLNPDKYSLIFVDIEIPDMNGFETTSTIRVLGLEQAKNIPIIGMTSDPKHLENFIEAGMNDLLEKPFDPDEVCITIKKRAFFLKNHKVKRDIESVKQGIAWDESLAIGNEKIDEQHHQLFEHLGNLVAACENGTENAKIKETLDFLVSYAVQYFNDEEALQVKYEYPDFKKHKKEHREFTISIGELVKRFKKNGSSSELSNDLNKIIVRWLINHIMHEDKKFAAYIRNVTGQEQIS